MVPIRVCPKTGPVRPSIKSNPRTNLHKTLFIRRDNQNRALTPTQNCAPGNQSAHLNSCAIGPSCDPFPLTPTLSLRERELAFPVLEPFKHPRLANRPAFDTPSPQGRGL